MIFLDFETFKYDWVLCWLDTDTQKYHSIYNDVEKLRKFYEYYKKQIMVGYNIRNYDQYILKAILCGFDPWKMNDFIINQDRKGYEFSRQLNEYPIISYDCSYFFRSLKELEAFGGYSIKECSVDWNIDRKLTKKEMKEVIEYCRYDVEQCFRVFVETKDEFESHVGLIKEFNLSLNYLSKTKAQLSAIILGAKKITRYDEFEITIPDNIILGKYEYIKEHFINWAKNIKDYDQLALETIICGVPHKLGIGGLHGAKKQYYGEGLYLMADVGSYYPAGMIEYDFLSRNVSNKRKFRAIRDDRIRLKALKDPRQAPRKIVLNATFGASKDKYNDLYDPLQANNLCIANQLFLIDLLEKLEGKCEIIQLTQWLK